MNIIHARSMPRSIISGVRGEADDPASLLAEINSGITTFRRDYGQRLSAIEKDLDKLTLRSAGAIASMGDGSDRRGANSPLMKAFGTFCRQRTASQQYWQEFVAQNPDAMPQASMSIGSNPDGGFTILPEVETTIVQSTADISPMRSLASAVTISTAEYKFVADPSMVQAVWAGEMEIRNQTRGLNFYETRIETNELSAMPAVTQSLLDDSWLDMGSYIAGRIGTAFSLAEGNAFVAGTGVKMPRGYLSYPSTAQDDFLNDGSGLRSRPWGTLQYFPVGAASSPSDVQLADGLVNMAASLRAPFRANARWMMSRQMYARIATIKDQFGRYLLNSSNGGLVDGRPELLCGFPIGADNEANKFDENLPTSPDASNVISIALGDWKQGFLIVDRIGLRLLRDPYTVKPFVLFFTTKRQGSGVLNFDAIKLLKTSES